MSFFRAPPAISLHKKRFMGKTKPNYTHLASELLRGFWLMNDGAKFLPAAMKFFSHLSAELPEVEEAISYTPVMSVNDSTPGGGNRKKEKCVAIIPLHGVMTKYDTCTSYGTSTLAAKITEAAADDNVAAIVLDVDSGGGSCNAVPPLIEAINAARAAGKPVLAHCDMAASAAYWVATQCNLLYMDNGMSSVGSIGALSRLIDDRAQDPQTGYIIIEVYADESPDKNRAYREALEGHYELLKKELSRLVGMFRDSVKAARPNIDADAQGVMTGACFYTDDAIRLGMADGRKTLAETIEIAFALAEN